jgi:hypothetical protein
MDKQTNKQTNKQTSLTFKILVFMSALCLLFYSCNRSSELNENQIQNKAAEVRTSSSCNPSPASGCTRYPITDTYVVAGCTFDVTFNLDVCGNSATISSMICTPKPFPFCQDFTNLVSNLTANGKFEELNTLWNGVYSNASSYMEKNYLPIYFLPSDFQCGSNTVINSTITATSCIFYCGFRTKDGNINASEGQCGTSCCIRNTMWCYEGTTLKELGTNYGQSPQCSGVVNCNDELQSECIISCDRVVLVNVPF